MFVNQSRDTGAWVKIRLRGTRANRHGLGARIRVRARNTQGKEITRTWHMDNGTGFGSSPYQAHIGLADATSITDVEVRWPGERRSTHYSAQINTATVLTQSGE